jgi:hypothetical protein
MLNILKQKEKPISKWEKIYREIAAALSKGEASPHKAALLEMMKELENKYADYGQVDSRWIYDHYQISKASLYYHTITRHNLPFIMFGKKRMFEIEQVDTWARRYRIEEKEEI